MKAILITAYGGPDVLSVTELPDPVPAAGEVLIRVRAFGLNHAETYMRSGAWGEVAQVPGIECAGTVEADPSGRLAPGTPVIAILGGMGRTRNGSYAELVTVPAGNVVPVSTSLSWTPSPPSRWPRIEDSTVLLHVNPSFNHDATVTRCRFSVA